MQANIYSDPYMFAGWEQRCCWLQNDGGQDITFTFEIDQKGDNVWKELTAVQVKAGQSGLSAFCCQRAGRMDSCENRQGK